MLELKELIRTVYEHIISCQQIPHENCITLYRNYYKMLRLTSDQVIHSDASRNYILMLSHISLTQYFPNNRTHTNFVYFNYVLVGI